MNRVHKKVQQSGEMVFVDATSNTEERNEQERTLKQGFEMLRSCLPEYAFNDRGREQGPQVILTDNCKE